VEGRLGAETVVESGITEDPEGGISIVQMGAASDTAASAGGADGSCPPIA
jgi:hypothetical protein